MAPNGMNWLVLAFFKMPGTKLAIFFKKESLLPEPTTTFSSEIV